MNVSVSVFGLGYLGATHAVCMAELGHDVVGVDVDEVKVAKLQAGEVPFYEPELERLLRENLESGRLRFTTSYADAAQSADVHFIAVGTPQLEGGLGADLSHVNAVVDGIAPFLTRPAVLFGKSTVPVGTAEGLRQRIRALAPAGDDIDLAWSPEFLREGFAVQDTLRPDRLVFGVDEQDRDRVMVRAREVYAPILKDQVPLLVTDLATSELVKMAANAFLATKISFINAMSQMCDRTGSDVTQLAEAIGYDVRIGHQFLRAGIGFGGGCLPKDIRALGARAGELGVGGVTALLGVVDDINDRCRSRVVDVALEECGSLAGARVAVLGATFKPNTDDVRDSPALDVASQLRWLDADVVVFDPMGMANAHPVLPQVAYAATAEEACAAADVVFVLTEWAEFRKLDPEQVGGLVRSKVVVDGRNCLDPAAWREAGWTYRGMGR